MKTKKKKNKMRLLDRWANKKMDGYMDKKKD